MTPEEIEVLKQDTKLEVLADVTRTLESIQNANNIRFDGLDTIIEDLEKRFALMFQAYGELAVMTEAILTRLASGSEEERESLRNDIHKGRVALFDLLRRGAQGGQPDGNPNGAFIPYGSQDPNSNDPQESS